MNKLSETSSTLFKVSSYFLFFCILYPPKELKPIHLGFKVCFNLLSYCHIHVTGKEKVEWRQTLRTLPKRFCVFPNIFKDNLSLYYQKLWSSNTVTINFTLNFLLFLPSHVSVNLVNYNHLVDVVPKKAIRYCYN